MVAGLETDLGDKNDIPAVVEDGKSGVNDCDKGSSRFSEDGMETEIEVTSEQKNDDENDVREKRKKQKKRKKKREESAQTEEDSPEKNVEEQEDHEPDVEKVDVPEIPEKVDDVESRTDSESFTKTTRKQNLKRKLKTMRDSPVYPLYLTTVGVICFVLPISIYVCDVMIGVNVLEDIGMELVRKQENLFNGTSPPLGDSRINYTHTKGTVLREAHRLARERGKRQILFTDVTPAIESMNMTTTNYSPTSSSTTSSSTTSSSSSSSFQRQNTTDSMTSSTTAYVTTEESPTRPQTDEAPTDVRPQPTDPPSKQFCKHTYYFVEVHKRMVFEDLESKPDWYTETNTELSRYQQTLFFMFIVIGFVFLLTSMGLRVDAFLNDQWSSSLLLIFLLYAISMSLAAKVFVIQSGSGGLRCFLCRLVSFCDDIDPWNLVVDDYFPTDFNWTTVVFVSVILKVLDCFAIAIVTLKYVLDTEYDLCWVIMLKVVGWLIIFPILVMSPVAGVIRYEVLPDTIPNNQAVRLAMEIIFYIGMAFWGIILIILPIFCKLRMCSDKEYNEEDDEEQYR